MDFSTGWEKDFEMHKKLYFELFENTLTKKQETDVSFLEDSIKKLTGRKHVILCASGTDALHFSIRALEQFGLVKGCNVIVPDFSWISTASSVAMANMVPVFCDVDLDSYHMSVDTVEEAISKHKPDAIVFPHLFGNMSDTSDLESLCKDKDIFFIEDACQAIGSKYQKKQSGTAGIISTFSFNANKNIAGIAGGGAILTDEDDVANFCRKIVVHGKGDFLGYNSKMLLLNAKVIDFRLKSIVKWQFYRQTFANIYNQAFKNLPVHIQTDPNVDHGYHKYTVRFETKALRDAMKKITGCAVHYDKTLSAHEMWNRINHLKMPTPNAKQISDTIMTLPLHHYSNVQDITAFADKFAFDLREAILETYDK